MAPDYSREFAEIVDQLDDVFTPGCPACDEAAAHDGTMWDQAVIGDHGDQVWERHVHHHEPRPRPLWFETPRGRRIAAYGFVLAAAVLAALDPWLVFMPIVGLIALLGPRRG